MLCSLVWLSAYSQNYNNEWINYSQTYYKFKVGATGLYRITQATLAGIGLGSTSAERFQLWRNGKEVPLYTTVATGAMGSADYIEFWGEMNDGKPDNALYLDPAYQLNDKWSLETDTAAFFLTVTASGGNLRYTPSVNTLPSSLPVEPYFMCTVGKYYKDQKNRGLGGVAGDLFSSSYDKGEGWTSTDVITDAQRTPPFVVYGSTAPVTFSNLFVYPAGPAPSVKVSVSGNSTFARYFKMTLNGDSVTGAAFNSFDYTTTTSAFPLSLINTNSAQVVVTNMATVACPASPVFPCDRDRMVVHKIEMQYPRQFNFGGADNFLFELPANAAGNYLEIAGFTFSGVNPVLYDLTNKQRYVCDISAAPLVKVALQPSATARQLLLVTQATSYIRDVSTLQQRNFINYGSAAQQGNYLIISHQQLTTGPGGSNPVEDYRAYRSSPAGGSHTAKVYLSDELRDQFGFGIKNNPAGVRNFIRWAKNNYSQPIKNVLLIGKGVDYINYRIWENDPGIDRLALVPTFGYPASDNLLGTDQITDVVPSVPVGRISAISGDEVAAYLQKVKQYEQQQAFSSPLINDKAWTKNVVHCVGASDGGLASQLTNAMNLFNRIISDTLYGANVTTFSKASSAPVDLNASEKLYNLFEKGIGVLTYFGHSSATSLEFNLDFPENYNNPSKYPIMVVLGCNAGNFYGGNPLRFTQKETLSEKFVLAPQRGSVAFIASTHTGTVDYLQIQNEFTYNEMGVYSYGKTIGEIMRNANTKMMDLAPTSYYLRFHAEQSTLHGDPALRADVLAPKPDYAIEDQYLKINPAFISVAENRFTVKAQFFNLAKAVNKNIVVELKRTYPDLTTEVIRRFTVPGTRYIDSISLDIDIIPTRDKGLNKISVCIDADNAVDELYESNNCVTKEFFIYEDEARPVFPYNYSIVNKQNIKLIASTANPFSGVKQYTMEMDTTELFNSPLKVTRTLSSAGGLLEFTPGVTFADSTVYYWRVSPVPTSGAPVWNGSSFVYLNPATFGSNDGGFNQSHYFQHTRSDTDHLSYQAGTRRWYFTRPFQNMKIVLGTWTINGVTGFNDMAVFLNDVSRIRLFCTPSTLQFNVIDPATFEPWVNDPATPLYGSGTITCDVTETRIHSFEYLYTDTTNRRKIMNFMKNVVPDGHYVVVRNITMPQNYGFPNAWAADWRADETYWGAGESVYQYLVNAGFSGIDSFYKTRPWTLVYKKNDPSFTPQWLVGIDSMDRPIMNLRIPISDTVGYLTSPAFGPAKAWKQLIWRGSADGPGDIATVDVIGVRNNGTEQVLFSGITTAQQNFNISSISATEFPFVKLKLRTMDRQKLTPYQLSYWRLTYDPVPEGAVAPNIFLDARDNVEAGEPATFKVAFKNISEAAFDSMKLKMVVTDANNVPHIIPLSKRRPLPTSASAPNDTLQIGAVINTATLPGLNTVYLEANPDNDQPEQHHFNNFVYRNLYVRPDSLHPLLDVTFDGVHILNRDLVSSKPEIQIKLKDESRWMVLDDTTLFTLQVRYPNGQLRRFYFNNTDTVHFSPAGLPPASDNTASINLTPFFGQDGEYELIVTGKDKSNNTAGAIEYRVLFVVINKPMISNMLNYPNPFTTSTAFVFTLTGSEVPQQLKIEILTVTGRVVREITKDELGPLHIGRNITEFKWDGTDQYGSKLANGVYLYRVVTTLNGKTLDKYTATGDKTDQYFNKGYGKMYLMR